MATLLEGVNNQIFKVFFKNLALFKIQARIAQLVAYRLGTGEVPGSNPGKGENLSVKILAIKCENFDKNRCKSEVGCQGTDIA